MTDKKGGTTKDSTKETASKSETNNDNTRKERIRNKGEEIRQNNYFTIVCIIAGVVLVILFIYLNIDKTYKSYKTIESFDRNDSNTKEYLSYDEDKIIRYSNDGITALDGKGNKLWSGSYEMKNPKAVATGKYVAVADIGASDVYVFDGNGGNAQIENVKSVSQIEVSSHGMVAILVDDGMANHILISDADKNYIDIKTRVKEDGYPFDIAFSPDSKKLVTSYMCVKDGKVNNYVTCYNFGEVGKNYESKIVAAYSFDDKMVPKVDFIDSSTFALFREDGFEVYTMKEIPTEKFKSDTYKYKMNSIFYTDEYIGVALDNDEEYRKEIKVYSMDGKIRFEKNIDYEYKSINMYDDDIIINNYKDAKIYTISGKTKFDGTFDMQIENILPYNNKEKYYFVTPQNILKVKLSQGD